VECALVLGVFVLLHAAGAQALEVSPGSRNAFALTGLLLCGPPVVVLQWFPAWIPLSFTVLLWTGYLACIMKTKLGEVRWYLHVFVIIVWCMNGLLFSFIGTGTM
jgi:hypothetical protein